MTVHTSFNDGGGKMSIDVGLPRVVGIAEEWWDDCIKYLLDCEAVAMLDYEPKGKDGDHLLAPLAKLTPKQIASTIAKANTSVLNEWAVGQRTQLAALRAAAPSRRLIAYGAVPWTFGFQYASPAADDAYAAVTRRLLRTGALDVADGLCVSAYIYDANGMTPEIAGSLTKRLIDVTESVTDKPLVVFLSNDYIESGGAVSDAILAAQLTAAGEHDVCFWRGVTTHASNLLAAAQVKRLMTARRYADEAGRMAGATK